MSRKKKSEFTQGYACALACIVRGHGANTEIEDALIANNMTSVQDLIDAGVDPHDIEALTPSVENIQNQKRN